MRDTTPGSAAPHDARQQDLAERLRVSRDRLAASELARKGQAWRLWSVCVAQTFGYSRTADRTFAVTLGREAGVHRNSASRLLRRFDELGVFGWEAAPPGSHRPSTLRLPDRHAPSTVPEDRHAPSTVPEDAPTRTAHGALHNNESLNQGQCRAAEGTPESLEGREAEPDAYEGFVRRLSGLSRDDLARLADGATPAEAEVIRAELDRRSVPEPRAPRPPFHDGPTSAEMDTEAWRIRHPRATR